MTHNHTQAAVELAGKIRCDDCFVVGGCDDNSTRLIKAALRTAHNAGLEEALKKIDHAIELYENAMRINPGTAYFNEERVSALEYTRKSITPLSDSLRDGEG